MEFNDLIGNEVLTLKQQYKIVIAQILKSGGLHGYLKITQTLANLYLSTKNKPEDLKFLKTKNRRLEFYDYLNKVNF